MLEQVSFFFLVSWGGVRPSALGTSITNYSIIPAPDDGDDECRAVGEMRIGRGNRSTLRKPAPVPLCPPQTPHAVRTRPRVATVGSQRLTAWATARPYIACLFFCLVCEAIATAATPGLLCQPRVIVKMIVEKQMECRLAVETEILGENLPQRHFCPSQNPTWPDPGLNPGRSGTLHVSYATASLIIIIYSHMKKFWNK
jgi:hypothetical protein